MVVVEIQQPVSREHEDAIGKLIGSWICDPGALPEDAVATRHYVAMKAMEYTVNTGTVPSKATMADFVLSEEAKQYKRIVLAGAAEVRRRLAPDNHPGF